MTQLAVLNKLAEGVMGSYRDSFFADAGPFARHLFPKSMDFFEATARYQNVNVFGSNRSSKSINLAYADACWATGDYPDWWPGRVFQKPVRGWVAGETGTLVRNNMQRYLMGSKEEEGICCFINGEQIQATSYQSKPVGLAEKIVVKSKFGGFSHIEFKSYDQGPARFASDTLDFVSLDEEPGYGIYAECTTRTATTRGIVNSAFTAVKGITPLIQTIAPEFCGGEACDPEVTGVRNLVIGWTDIPYSLLPKAERRRLEASYSSKEKQARMTGIPQLGEGAVLPVAESEFVIPYFDIPDHWPRIGAIDPGYQDPTGIVFGAYDMENDAIYVNSEYRKNLQHMAIHVEHVHQHGDWIPMVIDPAGANITDGAKVFQQYQQALRNPSFPAEKGLTDGLGELYDRMQDGRFFVLGTLRQWLGEFRAYMRDDQGRMPKRTQDHHFDLMDATRYLVKAIKHAKQRPPGFRFNGETMRAPIPGAVQQTVHLTEGLWS